MAFTYVQSAYQPYSAQTTTNTISMNVTQGHLIIVLARSGDSWSISSTPTATWYYGQPNSALADNTPATGSWVKYSGGNIAFQLQPVPFWCIAPATGTLSVTFTMVTAHYPALVMAEYSGNSATPASEININPYLTNFTAGMTRNVPAGGTTSGELYIATAIGYSGSTACWSITSSPAFTTRQHAQASQDFFLADYIGGAALTGNVTFYANVSSNGSADCQVFTFLPLLASTTGTFLLTGIE